MPNAIAKNTNTNKVYIDTVQIPRIKRNEEDYFYKTERFLDIVAKFFCECFSNSMEIFTKKCSGFTKKY